MAVDVQVVVIPFPDPTTGDTLLMWKAPSAGLGGGMRILDAYMVNHATLAAGTTFSVTLHKYSSAGTPAVNGTISTALTGVWTDSVPRQFTLTDAQAFLNAGEWLAVVYAETASGNPTRANLVLHVAQGK